MFNKESKQDSYSAKKLLDKAFCLTSNSSNDVFVKSPYYGHMTFWVDSFALEKKYSFFQLNESYLFFCIHCGMKVFDI